MKQHELKAKHFASARCIISPTWISSGHWAIQKERVGNKALFSSNETVQAAFPKLTQGNTMEDAKIEQVLTKQTNTEWVPLNLYQKFKRDLIALYRSTDGRYTGVKCSVLEAVGIDECACLYNGGDPSLVLTVKDLDRFVMPVKLSASTIADLKPVPAKEVAA